MAKISDTSINTNIYKEIRNMILNRELLQGEKIPEMEIAAKMHVSRTPIREAIRRLSWDGLITIEPNKSPIVRVMDQDLIEDLAIVRWQHEQLNIPLVVYNGSNRDFDELESLADKCLNYNRQGDLNKRNKYDAKYHEFMYTIGGNRILASLNRQISLMVQLWQVYHIPDPETLSESLALHFDIVQALRARDTDKVIDLMHQHLSSSYNIDF
ncbi:MAG: GntR family transcriptional regulator [Lachnospiraceae bacterium]|nr:GntR family transcriptional regulator [Lachnospiraceae bacterium]